MKFNSSLKFQYGINYSSLAAVVLFLAGFYLIGNRITSQQALIDQEAKQKVELQKRISKEIKPSELEKTSVESPLAIDSKSEKASTKQLEIKTENRKSSTRELGFDIDFGSEQPRIIRNFILPEASNAGSGRVILKFRFTIRPDGSVSKVFPTMKGDPDLELETMNLLRKWRFEKLSTDADQIDQKVEISFRPQ